LLIVGERDEEVLMLNKKTYDVLKCEKALKIVPQATHLFEEPGTLAIAAMLATEWFKKYL
jgi:putative phosphoribosyl transferase